MELLEIYLKKKSEQEKRKKAKEYKREQISLMHDFKKIKRRLKKGSNYINKIQHSNLEKIISLLNGEGFKVEDFYWYDFSKDTINISVEPKSEKEESRSSSFYDIGEDN